MRALLVSTAMALSVGAAPALAQQTTPGLWEHSISMKTAGGQTEASIAQAQQQMQQQMATMPPDQRKMMEEMMARQGLSVGAPGKGMTVRYCLSPEQAARDEMPQQNASCKQTETQRSGNVLKFKFNCTGKEPSSGEATFTFASSKEWKGHMTANVVINGKPERMEGEQSARWISADCGAIKPRP